MVVEIALLSSVSEMKYLSCLVHPLAVVVELEARRLPLEKA